MIGVIFALILLLWFWPSLWERITRGRLQVSVALEASHVTIGQEVPLTMTIRNTAWVPCPYVEATLDLPEGLAADAAGVNRTIRVRTYLMMRQEVTFQLSCFATRRGRQWFGRRYVNLHSNEGLGFRSEYTSYPLDGEVVVMPDFTVSPDLKPQVQALVGQREVMRWMHMDESLLRGIREYKAGDPFKHLAWHASARVGKWMTKQFSSSTDATIDLLLNAQGGPFHWNSVSAIEFDHLCSIAATWSRALNVNHIHCRFGTNAIYPNDPKHRWFGELHSEVLRMLLGRLDVTTACDFGSLLETVHVGRSPHPVIIVTSFLTDEQLRTIRRMTMVGYTFTVAVGPSWAKSFPHIPGVTWVTSPITQEAEGVAYA